MDAKDYAVRLPLTVGRKRNRRQHSLRSYRLRNVRGIDVLPALDMACGLRHDIATDGPRRIDLAIAPVELGNFVGLLAEEKEVT